MYLDEIIELCLSCPGATQSTPFGPDALVFKVGDKIFAIASPDRFPPSINLKCDPDRAVELRDRHAAILPGYHMNKRHWNTVLVDQSLPDKLLPDLVRHSYDLIFARLPKTIRARIADPDRE